MSSGEDTRKKRDNAQAEHEEEKPKKAKKVSAAIRTSRNSSSSSSSSISTGRRQHHQLHLNSSERRGAASGEGRFGPTRDVAGPAVAPAPCGVSSGSNSQAKPAVAGPGPADAPHDRRTPATAAAAAAVPSSPPSLPFKKPKRKVWDLESALLYLVQIDGVGGGSPEYLTADEDCSITFRMAHAGDAAPIANWYRQRQEEEALERAAKEQEDVPEIVIRPPPPPPQQSAPAPPSPETNAEEEPAAAASSMLEHWLSEGLGDEDACPSVYGLMAYVRSGISTVGGNGDDESEGAKRDGDVRWEANTRSDRDDNTDGKVLPQSPPPTSQHSRLAAVVLLTTAWTSGERNLRIEWMAVDHPKNLPSRTSVAVQQKVWLRLASLAVMTACQLIAIDDELLKAQTDAVNQQNAARKGGGSKCDKTKKPSSERLLPSAE